MKTSLLRRLCCSGALFAVLLGSLSAQIIEFRATIDSAQSGTISTASGTAVLKYDLQTNLADLQVTLNDFVATLGSSHIHEGAAGASGSVVVGLGDETVYARTGNTLTATFKGLSYGGTPLTLLQNGAYLNFHTTEFPAGEIRGQLIAQPKRLAAILAPASGMTSYGAAYITYNPGTNQIWTHINVFNFTNTLTNSHYHEAPLGSNGPVAHGLGGASVYTKLGNFYGGQFNGQTYLGDPIKLLTGGAYLNVHSNVKPGGEVRGQVHVIDELDVSRLINISSRGFVGTGEQALINGFVITGAEPVEVVVTAKGPFLSGFGVSAPLADPQLTVVDTAGNVVSTNDDFADGFASADIPVGFAPTNAKESALLLVLPPGTYTSVVGGAGGTSGIALAEVYEVRPATAVTSGAALAAMSAPFKVLTSGISSTHRPLPEFCSGVPLAPLALLDHP